MKYIFKTLKTFLASSFVLPLMVNSTVIGVSTLAIMDLAIPHQAIAQRAFPQGFFKDSDYSVNLRFYDNDYFYEGTNMNTGAGITLSGATISGNYRRQVYTWNNGGVRYQISWRPADPRLIRIEVIQSNGRVTLNRLLREH